MTEANPQAPRRRWLQFGLRSLLALMLLASVAAGWWAYQRDQLRRERAALAEVRRLQSELTRREWYWIEQPLTVETRPLPWWLSFDGERSRAEVTAVSFDLRSYDDDFEEPSGVGDEDLHILAAFSNLKSLRLPRSRVGDAGLTRLTNLRRLETLDLSQSRVTDRGLEHLGRLRSLESLMLDGLELQGAGLAHLEGCRRLRELSLRRTPLRSEHAELLNQLTSLESLTLESSTLGRLHLRDLPRLRRLTLTLSAADVDLRLERLPQLEQVAITLMAPRPPRRLHLAELAKLTQLSLHVAGEIPGEPERPTRLVVRALPAVRKIGISGKNLAAALAPQIAQLPSLQEISFPSKRRSLDDAAAAALSRLPELRRLDLGRTAFTDEGLRRLAAIRSLETLSLEATSATDLGVRHLAALPRLRSLQLVGIRFQGDAGATLRRLRTLEELSLADCQLPAVTLNGAGSERPFRRLRTLRIVDCTPEEVQARALPALADLSIEAPQARILRVDNLPKLRRLDISLKTGQTVEQLTLRGLPQLEWISLQCGAEGARVPGQTFNHLLEMPRLRNGIVWGLEMPPEAREQLERWEKATGRKL